MVTVTAAPLTRPLPLGPLTERDLVGLVAPGVTIELVDGAVVLSRRGGFTREELDAIPEDGRRHELIDGIIVMPPSPGHLHQRAVGRMFRLLEDGCPPGAEALVGPFDVALADRFVVIPDVMVARRTDITARDLPVAPLLAVEVLSPSTRRVDLGRKRTHYLETGTASYWVVDPLAPRLTVWDLVEGQYVEIADVSGEESWTASAPYPVTVVPADLVR